MIGLVGWNTASGLGYQNRELARQLPVDRWLIPRHPRYAELDGCGAVKRVHCDRDAPDKLVCRFLEGLKWVLFCETPYIQRLPMLARQSGIQVCCIPNHEWFRTDLPWVQYVDLMLAPTRHTFDLLSKIEKPSWQLEYLPAPIDTDQFKFKQRYECRRFLFVNGWGGSNGRKGLEIVLEAARLTPQIQIIVRSQATLSHSIPANVIVEPAISDRSELYAEGDVFIQPSRWEGIGFPLLEAQACGLPLVTTGASPMNEYRPLRTIRCRSRPVQLAGSQTTAYDADPQHLAEIMQELSGQEIGKASQAARAFVEHEHSWKRIGSRLRCRLGDVLKSPTEKILKIREETSMHPSSLQLMQTLVEKATNGSDDCLRILDVGSQNVNGSYRSLFDSQQTEYVGLDMAAGRGVDYVPADPYDWRDLPDDSFDLVVSGQALEHIEFPWLTLEQIARKLKPQGRACLIAPSKGPEHRYPVDCYRYYPDGLAALANWVGLEVLESGYDKSAFWGDCFVLLSKPADWKPADTKSQEDANRNGERPASTLDELYADVCQGPSEIHEHCSTLRELAEQCNHVTEFGTRQGKSTTAFLAAQPEQLISVDIETYAETIDRLEPLAGKTDLQFRTADVLEIEIEPTDLLFIDTSHVYWHLKRELEKHASQVARYLLFHDTTTFGEWHTSRINGSIVRQRGIRPAIDEFLNKHADWNLMNEYRNNNGLMVLERRSLASTTTETD